MNTTGWIVNCTRSQSGGPYPFGGGFKVAGHSSLLKLLESVTELSYAPVYLRLYLASLGTCPPDNTPVAPGHSPVGVGGDHWEGLESTWTWRPCSVVAKQPLHPCELSQDSPCPVWCCLQSAGKSLVCPMAMSEAGNQTQSRWPQRGTQNKW